MFILGYIEFVDFNNVFNIHNFEVYVSFLLFLVLYLFKHIILSKFQGRRTLIPTSVTKCDLVVEPEYVQDLEDEISVLVLNCLGVFF